jgi:beta-glucosidase
MTESKERKLSHSEIKGLVEALTLEEKISILTGCDFWNTQPNATINLRKLLLSDGPAGVRGEFWDERDNSLNLPSGTALGSTWDPEFAFEVGMVLADEAQRKGVDVVLGPTINLHRSPLGGRHFECLSEDPYLTGAISVGLIKGVQSKGKGSCPKHFVANDSETDRMNVNVRVDDRSLREVYLRPFEDAITKAKAWAIMSAYNSVNGVTMTENGLLQDPLRSEWNFDGVVISDWTAVRSLESARAEQDLVMPGPHGPWGEALVAAVKEGLIEESAIDRKVERILLLATRVGAIGNNTSLENKQKLNNDISDDFVAFSRRAASEGSVLLKNDSVLPLNLNAINSVALLGHNARLARSQGGGSATVLPKNVVTPFSALKNLFGEKLHYGTGAIVQEGIIPFAKEDVFNKTSGTPGLQISMFDGAGELIHTEARFTTDLIWLDSHAPLPDAARMHINCTYTPRDSGAELLGFGSIHPVVLNVNGQEFLKASLKPTSEDPFSSLMAPAFISKSVSFEAGREVEIDIDIDLRSRTGVDVHAMSFKFGIEADKSADEQNIKEAVALARSSDIAIVVVGTNSDVESEGADRVSINLPGRQDELVRAVAEVNPNTIVIVNSGSPVLMPWASDVQGILLTYFGGQEIGNALVDMLTGKTEPGGRLPTTWASSESDIPVSNCTPDYPSFELKYEEGVHIGYRAWLRAARKPLYPFGFGLGYTTWEISDLRKSNSQGTNANLEILVTVTNEGARAGKHVVQVYASRPNSVVDRPALWLIGHAIIRAQANEEVTVLINIPSREFAYWDNGWIIEPGEFNIHIGSNVYDLPLMTTHTFS